ncbi:high affinity cationic amino acid transporter 1 isoform X1 [Hydra vulgaris]|uniref:high affinity cationic amino acid transporter 1 isoform X1 n=1 Tax=Hydra vulgaris TaxID=6087 RepID=UPI001F5FCC90|nr:high affinity cationic amino acid transporter 1 [Hydra vulgaris]XP_047138018.1 high affinity cationic amino acid transporter 1 [Hydra vulgaris]XP_047138020.1 high affinity cationic amino acid transporter 1 [Hydra vulgaris]
MWKNSLVNLHNLFSRKKTFLSACNQDTNLKRCLSTLDLTLIGIGSTLGSGIYVLTGEVAKTKTGPAIVISFLIAAFASILSGLCYAEFAARIPKAGSAYVYCYVTMGEFWAFIIGWNLLLEYIIGASVVARGLIAYIDTLAGGVIKNQTLAITGEVKIPGMSSYIDFLSFVVVMVFTVFISCGMKNSARLNNVCVVINIVTILSVISVGTFYAKIENWSNFAPFGFDGVIAGASTCFFSFIGFDVIANVSEEAKNPSKSIPISMIGTITICFFAYFGVSGVVTLMVNYKNLDESAAVADAFKQRGLNFMNYIISAGAICGLLGSLLVSIIPIPRMLYSMSQDGLLFNFFSIVHPKSQVPVISTILSGLFIGILAAIIDLAELVEMMSIGTLLAYSIVVICVLILRYDLTPPPNNNYESESLIENEKNKSAKNCFEAGCSMNNISLVINIVVFLIVVELLVICIIVSFYHKQIAAKNITFIVFLVIFIIALVATVIYLFVKDTTKDNLAFKVPMIPWIPVVALFFNVYLMSMLSQITWIRFGIWLFIGLLVYFLYGIRYSKVDNIDVDEFQLVDRFEENY